MNSLLNWLQSLHARFTRKERLRISKLEAQLAEAQWTLRFYATTGNYPEFRIEGQGGLVLADAGSQAREALRRTGGLGDWIAGRRHET